MPLPPISPPLLNSASPWATTEEDLQKLFDCKHTGAITTRTALLDGFAHDPTLHQYAFFHGDQSIVTDEARGEGYVGSLNTLGYSPIRLDQYLETMTRVVQRTTLRREEANKKCCIISVTGTPNDVAECYRRICAFQTRLTTPLCMEVNLSCPNIPGKPPPAYSAESLSAYLDVLQPLRQENAAAIGLKTPPYTYQGQFEIVINALLSLRADRPIDFITATNTVGSSLVLAPDGSPTVASQSGTGIGGMAGSPLHALSLGNVKILRTMLDEHVELRSIDLIGVGGVSDTEGYRRMRACGAKIVALATALGEQGLQVFERIETGPTAA